MLASPSHQGAHASNPQEDSLIGYRGTVNAIIETQRIIAVLNAWPLLADAVARLDSGCLGEWRRYADNSEERESYQPWQQGDQRRRREDRELLGRNVCMKREDSRNWRGGKRTESCSPPNNQGRC